MKESQARGENPYASPRSLPAAGRTARPQPLDAGGHRAGRGVVIAICCLLVLVVVAVFVQTARHDFVNCDDNEYVYENLHIQRGLTPASAWWAITQAHSANWHPLTWMSHTLDWQVFGTWDADWQRYVDSWPGGHHLVNVLLHAVNAVLLFLILQEMTGATWPSAFVAALFAIHPLRVESVAWVTERKDMLSGLFFLLTLAAYQAYAARPFSWWRYGLVVVSFRPGAHGQVDAGDVAVGVALVGLLAAATDWAGSRAAQTGPADSTQHPAASSLILIRHPLCRPRHFFPLTGAGEDPLAGPLGRVVRADDWRRASSRPSSRWTCNSAWAMPCFPTRPTSVRCFIRREWSCNMYIRGRTCSGRTRMLPLAVLVSITLAVVWLGWRRRYLAVGWFWYLGMLVPVIGLVQVGAQARADRYTYLTQIGLYIMIAWGLRDVARAWRGWTALYAAVAAPIIAALAVVAWMQTTYWRNSLTLWEHSVACQRKQRFCPELVRRGPGERRPHGRGHGAFRQGDGNQS